VRVQGASCVLYGLGVSERRLLGWSALSGLCVPRSQSAQSNRLTALLTTREPTASERLDRSHAEAERKKEACSINQSLSALGDVFGALSSKTPHVPYRNSKLTYLLQVGFTALRAGLGLHGSAACISRSLYPISPHILTAPPFCSPPLLFTTRLDKTNSPASAAAARR